MSESKIFEPSFVKNGEKDERSPADVLLLTPPQSPLPTSTVTPDVRTTVRNQELSKPPKEEKKKEFKRKPNTEEHSFCLLNICFCFFFPYVCKIDPISDDDIYEPDSRDSSDKGHEKVKDEWKKKYEDYAKALDEYEMKKAQYQKQNIKEPSKPNLIVTLASCLITPSVIFAISLEAIAVASQLMQPWLMKQMLIVVMKKAIYEITMDKIKGVPPPGYPLPEKPGFPFVYAILIMLMPFMHGFFDAWANRLFFHFTGQFRSTCCALIYNKTLKLNISAQSNVNTGRILSLVSSDCRMIGEMLVMIIMLIWMPAQIIVPLIFVIADFKWVTAISFAVVIVLLPLQGVVSYFLINAMNSYLYYNDDRNKVTNETFQGIRIVKYSGLEEVFISKIQKPRSLQAEASFVMTISIQSLMSIIRALPLFVNGATIAVFVKAFEIDPENFAVDVMPSLGYLQQMTQPLTMMPIIIQAVSMLLVTINRVRDYLVLPELKQEKIDAPQSGVHAISVRDGVFKWAPPPEIPLSAQEKQGIEKEKARRLKEAKEKARQQSQQQEQKKSALSGGGDSAVTANNSGLIRGGGGINNPSAVIPTDSTSPSPDGGMNPLTPDVRVPSPLPTPSLSPSPYPTPSVSPASRDPNHPTLNNINFEIPFGSLTMIIGGVGSGKSSLGSALIGDIEKKHGEVCIAGTFAYCPQTAWINNNTVRGNITFGMPYEERKYVEVVRVCALEPDFRILAAGDQTAIGEKGVNLSGGQKARIQLARSVYADRDIYILDDPLSAVDAHVGRYILEECICGRLAQKTRVLMTNQLQFLERADSVILLNEGEIIAQGRYSELKEKGIDFSQYIIKKDESGNVEGEGDKEKEASEDEKEIDLHRKKTHCSNRKSKKTLKKKKEKEKKAHATTAKDLEGTAGSAGQQIMTEEEQATKGVSWGTYFRYFLALMPPVAIVLYGLYTAVIEGIAAFGSYWLGKIGDIDEFKQVTFWWKIGIYILIGVGVFILMAVRAFWSGFAVRRACLNLHSDLLNHVMHCPEVFFNTTPLGRILNRFSGDMTQIDQSLFMMLIQVITIWMQLVGNVVIIAIDTLFFLYIGLPILVVFYIVLLIYQRASRNLQRLESISRSPVISLFGETISGAGLSTIRAYHLEDDWKQRFYALNDAWTVRFVIFKEGQKWASAVASLVSTLFMCGVIIIGWFYMKTTQLAVAINSSMAFGFLGVFLVQQNVELESNMTSLERIVFYSTKLPQEAENASITPPADWPTEGKIEFDHVSFRYRPGLPYVLNDVSFSFRKGEKIGVCGRTGAGKSSLLFALFRLVELDPKLQPKMIDIDTGLPIDDSRDEPPNKGHIIVDGVDISKVALNRLRSSVSIIPQDPTLFTGTVRYNLDLPSRWTDDRIWEVLDMIEMRQAIADMPQSLDTQVAEGGSNFSCGQRQLLCFGRAILNNCRIVIMDEATASVDVETDAKIQNTIRNTFSAQTVLVIAHRLNTILGSDRILVMDAGRVAELDTPENLQNNPDSAFNGLLQSLTH